MKTIRILILTIAILLPLVLAQTSNAAPGLTRISKDPYTNSTSQHRTQVEPDTFSYGGTIVAAFQSGRFFNGGSSNIGWAASSDGGTTWARGFLPGTTTFVGGSMARISDPSITYDAKHSHWLIVALGISNSGQTIMVSRSANGGTVWANPVIVRGPNGGYDKTWMTCDNRATSPYYGNCYAMWDDAGRGGLIEISISSDGGSTWSTAQGLTNTSGLGVQPLTQPDGTLVVPYLGFDNGMYAIRSTNGGTTWNTPQFITQVTDHQVAGRLRSEPLPSAELDSAGKIYLMWQDCRFIKSCTANDLLMTTSSDGVAWSKVKRIPLDGKKSGVDHFIPGIAVDPNTSGNTAHLALTYYFYNQTPCTIQSCRLGVAYATSANGGATWSAPTKLASGIKVQQLPDTSLGYMVGDYISTSIVNGKAIPVFAIAGKRQTAFRESMYAPKNALPVLGGANQANSPRIQSVQSNHPLRFIYTIP